MRALLVLLCAAALTGCSLLPSWRVFQAKIDPKLAEKPPQQAEAERRAAALIVDLSATPTGNPAGRIAEIHAVAGPLSASLGEPLRRATVFEVPDVIAGTRAGILAEQRKAEQWKAFARKYAGKELEDTGINLAGPAGLLGLAAVVAACIACPALGWALLRGLPVLWGFFRQTTAAVSEFAQANPEAGSQLATALRGKLDRAHKRLVRVRAAAARLPEAIAHPSA